MAKIGGFSDKNFTEAVKLAQTAQKKAKKANDSADGIQTSLDGKITVGTTAPGNDQAAGHDKGDVWYVTDSDGVYTAQYYFDGVSWRAQKWDEQTLSVKNLSALSSNLGYIQNGTLDSVSITSTKITGGTITGGTIDGIKINGSTINGTKIKGSTIDGAAINGGSISGSSLSLTSGNTNYWLDDNGFHDSYYGNNIFNGYVKKDVRINESGMTISDGNYKVNIQPEQIKMSGGGGTGTIWSTNINWPAITIANNIQIKSQHIIHSIDYGALYFEGGSDGGEDGIDIHAGGVYSHGKNLLSEINRVDGKPDSSGDINRIDGDIERLRGDISDINGEISRIHGSLSNIREELRHKKNK